MCQNSVFAKFWVIKNEVFEKKIAFFVFLVYVEEIETKNGKDQKNPIKIDFLRWSSKNVKNKKMDFSKNCLTLFVSGREKNAHFRAHYLFWPKFFLDQNSAKQEAL